MINPNQDSDNLENDNQLHYMHAKNISTARQGLEFLNQAQVKGDNILEKGLEANAEIVEQNEMINNIDYEVFFFVLLT